MSNARHGHGTDDSPSLEQCRLPIYHRQSASANFLTMRRDIQGVCKVFYADEGWGWISAEDEEDVWVHFSEIQMSGFRSLSPGQMVRFDLEENPRLKEQSRRAVNVRLVVIR